MKIDKSKFLVLTSVLAAGTAAAALAAPGCSSTANGTSDGGASVDGSSGGGGDGGGGDGSTTGDGGGGGDGGGDAGECLGDDKVLNPSCASFLGDGGADAAAGTCVTTATGQAACSSFQANLRNGVAREAVKCLNVAPTCEAVPDPVVGCFDQAAAKACPDATAATFCTAQLAKCTAGSIGQADCVKYMTALTSSGRDKFAANCADEAGCAFGNLDSVKACIPFL